MWGENMVKVKFFGVLSAKMPEKDNEGYWITEAMGKTVRELLDSCPIKDTNIKYNIFVNNERRDPSCVLEEGDILTVIPLLAGG